MRKMSKKLTGLIVLLTAFLYAGTTLAKDEKPSGTVSISTTSIALGIGGQWGSGVLLFNGKQYNFDITGISLIDVGITTISAEGNVYRLNKVEDLAGTYTSAEAGFALAAGAGAATMKNQKDVVMSLTSTKKGIKLKLAPEGITVKLRGYDRTSDFDTK